MKRVGIQKANKVLAMKSQLHSVMPKVEADLVVEVAMNEKAVLAEQHRRNEISQKAKADLDKRLAEAQAQTGLTVSERVAQAIKLARKGA